MLKKENTLYKRQIILLNEKVNFLICDKNKKINNKNSLEHQLQSITDINKNYQLIEQKLNNYHNIERELERFTCQICMERLKDCILEPCMHFSCCIKCVSSLPSNSCPICRTECNYYTKIYTT